jgi:hypothetical protein
LQKRRKKVKSFLPALHFLQKSQPGVLYRAIAFHTILSRNLDHVTVPYWQLSHFGDTSTKRQVSKHQVSKRPVSKHMKRQVYKTSALQNVRFTKCQVYKMSGLQNVRLKKKNLHIYSVLVVGGNPQVLLKPCLQAK